MPDDRERQTKVRRTFEVVLTTSYYFNPTSTKLLVTPWTVILTLMSPGGVI
jgi:hypothetical protein